MLRKIGPMFTDPLHTERGKRDREGRRDGEPERGGEGEREKQSTCRYERSSATFIFAGLGEAECASGTTTTGVAIQHGMCRSCSYEDSKSVGVGCRSRHLSHLSFTNSSGFFQFAVHVGPEPALLKVRPGLLYVLTVGAVLFDLVF